MRTALIEFVMPGLVPGIHVFGAICKKDVDGRDKPGHDEEEVASENTTASGRGAAGGRVEHRIAPRFAT